MKIKPGNLVYMTEYGILRWDLYSIGKNNPWEPVYEAERLIELSALENKNLLPKMILELVFKDQNFGARILYNQQIFNLKFTPREDEFEFWIKYPNKIWPRIFQKIC